MKLLESFRIRAAAKFRRQQARVGLGGHPARLELRLDDFDAPGAIPAATLDLDGWQARIVEFIQWAGPAPLRITAHAGQALLPDLVRFGHRLEMPVTVRTGPAGLDVERAEELVDRGMARCELVAPGVTAEAESALRALVHARHTRGASLTVHLHVPVAPGAPGLRGAAAAARGLGVDGIVVSGPWQGFSVDPPTRAAITEALGEGWPMQATSATAKSALAALGSGGPGGPRSGGHCALGGLRLQLLPDGSAWVCPFKPGRATGPLADSASELAAHRDAIRRCDRQCGHPELV